MNEVNMQPTPHFNPRKPVSIEDLEKAIYKTDLNLSTITRSTTTNLTKLSPLRKLF